jgi:hypothetical protein
MYRGNNKKCSAVKWKEKGREGKGINCGENVKGA